MSDEYDPDMDVREALRLGLVVPVDGTAQPHNFSGKINYCRVGFPFLIDRSFLGSGAEWSLFGCGKPANHEGEHVYVLRWKKSWKQHEKELMQQHDRLEARANQVREMKEKVAKAEAELAGKMIEAAKAVTEAAANVAAGPEFRRLQQQASMAYGPDQSKRNKYRDRHVGKVRGK